MTTPSTGSNRILGQGGYFPPAPLAPPPKGPDPQEEAIAALAGSLYASGMLPNIGDPVEAMDAMSINEKTGVVSVVTKDGLMTFRVGGDGSIREWEDSASSKKAGGGGGVGAAPRSSKQFVMNDMTGEGFTFDPATGTLAPTGAFFGYPGLDPKEAQRMQQENWQAEFNQRQTEHTQGLALAQSRLAEEARQADNRAQVDQFQTKAGLLAQVPGYIDQQAARVQDILANSGDAVYRDFMTRGGESPLGLITQADQINSLLGQYQLLQQELNSAMQGQPLAPVAQPGAPVPPAVTPPVVPPTAPPVVDDGAGTPPPGAGGSTGGAPTAPPPGGTAGLVDVVEKTFKHTPPPRVGPGPGQDSSIGIGPLPEDMSGVQFPAAPLTAAGMAAAAAKGGYQIPGAQQGQTLGPEHSLTASLRPPGLPPATRQPYTGPVGAEAAANLNPVMADYLRSRYSPPVGQQGGLAGAVAGAAAPPPNRTAGVMAPGQARAELTYRPDRFAGNPANAGLAAANDRLAKMAANPRQYAGDVIQRAGEDASKAYRQQKNLESTYRLSGFAEGGHLQGAGIVGDSKDGKENREVVIGNAVVIPEDRLSSRAKRGLAGLSKYATGGLIGNLGNFGGYGEVTQDDLISRSARVLNPGAKSVMAGGAPAPYRTPSRALTKQQLGALTDSEAKQLDSHLRLSEQMTLADYAGQADRLFGQRGTRRAGRSYGAI